MKFAVLRLFSLLSVATLTGGFGLAGCASPSSQSTGEAVVSSPVPSGSQPRLAQEKARIGDSPESVRLAMGDPDEKRAGAGAGGRQSTWIYKNYFQKTGRMEQTGWKEVLVPGIEDQKGTVIQKPVTQDIYRTEVNADIEVTFTRGVVSSVEQLRH
jgi:hypothetical protein